jgi:hypothetical protein
MLKYLNREPSFLDVAILPLLVICARDPKPAEGICFVRQDLLIFLPRKEQQKLEGFLCYLVQSF